MVLPGARFHEEGEEDVDGARALLDLHRGRAISVRMLDLAPYELGNAVIRGGARLAAEQVAIVVEAAREICTAVAPTDDELAYAAHLAVEHELTLYDAAYAAVANRRGAALATHDAKLLASRLGSRPRELLASG